jgi:hypothetical protein
MEGLPVASSFGSVESFENNTYNVPPPSSNATTEIMMMLVKSKVISFYKNKFLVHYYRFILKM